MVRVCCTKCGKVFEFAEEMPGSAVSFCGNCQTMFSYAVGRALYEATYGKASAPQRRLRDPAMPRSTCPKCGAVLQLTDDMVNEQIECGSCQAVFVAKPDAPASRREESNRPSRRRMSEPDDEDRPSRRRQEDDRPSRRRRDEEEDDERPRRRSRSRADEDDEGDERPRRRPPSGAGQGLAITSLILGIVSLPLGFCCGLFSLPVSVAGVIFGIIGIVKTPQSKGLAITGTVLSGVGIVLAVLMVILGVAMNVANFGAGGGRPGPNNPPFGPQRNNPPPPWKR